MIFVCGPVSEPVAACLFDKHDADSRRNLFSMLTVVVRLPLFGDFILCVVVGSGAVLQNVSHVAMIIADVTDGRQRDIPRVAAP